MSLMRPGSRRFAPFLLALVRVSALQQVPLAPYAPSGDPALGIYDRDNETQEFYFRPINNGGDLSSLGGYELGGVAIAVEVVARHAGNYRIGLLDRPGGGPNKPRTFIQDGDCYTDRLFSSASNADSFYLCTDDPRSTGVNPDPDPDVSSCREYICCGRTSLFRLEADRNTLYLANRDVCSLSAGLEIASYTCDQELVVSSCDASSGSSSCWQAYDGVQTAWGTEGACTCVDARGRRVRGGRGASPAHACHCFTHVRAGALESSWILGRGSDIGSYIEFLFDRPSRVDAMRFANRHPGDTMYTSIHEVQLIFTTSAGQVTHSVQLHAPSSDFDDWTHVYEIPLMLDASKVRILIISVRGCTAEEDSACDTRYGAEEVRAEPKYLQHTTSGHAQMTTSVRRRVEPRLRMRRRSHSSTNRNARAIRRDHHPFPQRCRPCRPHRCRA